MTIVGRLTKDAIVNQLKDDRKVVSFTVAVNDYYKPKGREQGVSVTSYFDCAYWISPAIALQLKKGTLVELFGRIGLNAYTALSGEAKARLTLHVNNIKVHQGAKREEVAAPETAEPVGDLPF